MGKAVRTVNFTKKWVKSKTKAQFIKAFEKVYPELDLEAEYYRIVGKPKPEKVEEKKED